jgi:peptidoglycan/LPS O-acetylase OafA/YrhL
MVVAGVTYWYCDFDYALWEGRKAIAIKPGLIVLMVAIFSGIRKSRAWAWLARGFRYFAGCSYTLYVVHFPLLCLAFSLFHLRYMSWGLYPKGLFLVGLVIGVLALSSWLSTLLENKAFWKQVLLRLHERYLRA